MKFDRYYHDIEKRRVVHVSGSTSPKTYRRKFAGYDVMAHIHQFSASKGERTQTDHRKFDERDSEERAISFYLMRAPMTGGTSGVTQEEYNRLLIEYRNQFAASQAAAKHKDDDE